MTHGPDHRLSKPGEEIGQTLWLHAANYDYTRHLSHRGWAWEFLRRNKDYVVDWGGAQAEVTTLPGKGGRTALKLNTGALRMQRWGLIFR